MALNNQRLALSGLLAFTASILLITEQTTGDFAIALNSESVKELPDELESAFDLEDVGQHWLPAELRGLKSKTSKSKKTSSSSSSKSKSSSSSARSTAFIALYTTTRLSRNRYNHDTGFDEDKCDQFWALNPSPTEEEMNSEEYVKICTYDQASGLAYGAAVVAAIVALAF